MVWQADLSSSLRTGGFEAIEIFRIHAAEACGSYAKGHLQVAGVAPVLA